MADYIYTLESRLTPDQMRGVTLIQEISRAAGLNVYLTGGAVRDILTGFPIRDLDFTLQGNPLKLQKELEKVGAVIHGTDDHTNTLYLNLPGNVRAEISMARSEQHLKTGKPPVITPATITEDLRRRPYQEGGSGCPRTDGRGPGGTRSARQRSAGRRDSARADRHLARGSTALYPPLIANAA